MYCSGRVSLLTAAVVVGALSAGLGLPVSGRTITVDLSGDGDFTEIQAAIDADRSTESATEKETCHEEA